VKRELIADEQSRGLAQLYGDLSRIDPDSAARIHPNDRQRIFRALEVFYIGGVPLSVLQKGHGFKRQLFPAVKVFINRDREDLFERINRRVDRMLEAGLKDEVEGLLAMGYSAELKSMQSIGYRQMAAHLAGAISIQQAAHQIKRETRRYAKRQITWFRGQDGFQSFNADDIEGIWLYVRQGIEESRRQGVRGKG
jgi:tRNA dimethylallyltransferase